MGITVLHVHAVPPPNHSATEVSHASTATLSQQQKTSTTPRPRDLERINPASTSEVVDLVSDDVDEDNDDCVVVLDDNAFSAPNACAENINV